MYEQTYVLNIVNYSLRLEMSHLLASVGISLSVNLRPKIVNLAYRNGKSFGEKICSGAKVRDHVTHLLRPLGLRNSIN